MEYRVFAVAFDIETAPQGSAQQNSAQIRHLPLAGLLCCYRQTCYGKG